MLYSPGTRVVIDHPDHPGVWIVERNGPKYAVLRPETGVGQLLRAPHTRLSLAGDRPVVTAEPLPEHPHFVLGQFVTVSDREGVYVVIADKGAKVNVVRAGGDGDRYIRAPRSLVKPVGARVELDVQSGGVGERA